MTLSEFVRRMRKSYPELMYYLENPKPEQHHHLGTQYTPIHLKIITFLDIKFYQDLNGDYGRLYELITKMDRTFITNKMQVDYLRDVL